MTNGEGDGFQGERGMMMKKMLLMVAVLAVAMAAKADCWMTFCKMPGGQQYSQVWYVRPDADGFVTIKAGPVTVVVYKTQVWCQKMPGELLKRENDIIHLYEIEKLPAVSK